MHRYTPRYRPPSTFTLPPGWRIIERGTHTPEFSRRTDVPCGHHRFGVVEYDRRLSDEEREHYDLEIVP